MTERIAVYVGNLLFRQLFFDIPTSLPSSDVVIEVATATGKLQFFEYAVVLQTQKRDYGIKLFYLAAITKEAVMRIKFHASACPRSRKL